jgi:cellulose synthase/poly-beta-1,6-N-acetylglucosamine synthase-like glycosyltransferase
MYITFETIVIYFLTYFSLLITIFFLLSLFEEKKLKKSSYKKLPKVSILIPAHNEAKIIRKTLDSIRKLKYPKKKVEIIVIDDGSTDDTYKVVKNYGRGVKVFRKKQGGKASALNFGIKKCSGEFVLALDADCLLHKNCLNEMLKYFDKRVMCVVPAIKVFKPKNIWEKLQRIEYTLSNFTRKILWFISSMHIAPGAPLFRKKFLDKHKFDEGNLTEDLEMGLKIKSKGYEIAFAPTAIVHTLVPNTFKKLLRQRIRWAYGFLYNLKKYGFLFGLKHGDLSAFVLPIILVSIGASCFTLIYVATRSAHDFIKALRLSFYTTPYFQLAQALKPTRIPNFLLTETFYFTMILFMIGFIFYVLAMKDFEEKLKLNYFFYILVYGWVLFLFNLIATILFLTRRKVKW